MAAQAHTISTVLLRLTRWLARLGAILAMLAAGDMAAQSPTQSPTVPDEPAMARSRQLDELFTRLLAAKEESEADGIVSGIWQLWQQSGDTRLDEAMHQAVLLMGSAPGEALPILDDIVARKPGWAEGWNKRATVLYLIGEYDRSLADIDRVLALEPRHFGALAGIGLIRIEKGQLREGLQAFRQALAINPFLRERHGIIPELERELGEKPI
jgi:tetratricopeptide (TPR) repeat protein